MNRATYDTSPGSAWDRRVRQLEAEGLTTSDAQGAADAEFQQASATPRTDALARVNAGRPHNHGLAPGNPGYEGLDAYKDRKYAEMTALARQLERDNARLRAALEEAADALELIGSGRLACDAARAALAKVRP